MRLRYIAKDDDVPEIVLNVGIYLMDSYSNDVNYSEYLMNNVENKIVNFYSILTNLISELQQAEALNDKLL